VPGIQLQTAATVLSRQPAGSDAFELLAAFSAEHGLLQCLRRLSTKAATNRTPLDLFDAADLWLESSNQGRTWFIKEHRLLRRHAGIGRSYAALRRAAAFSALLTRNPVSDESRPAVATLLAQCLDALDAGAPPDVVWLKTLYCFARDEGYAVKQQWWPQLPAADQAAATRLLNTPLAELAGSDAAAAGLVTDLEQWFAGHTEIRLQ
jgi:hypothetical protein